MANVLVVDDEKGIRTTIRAFLRKDGHQAEEASNGREALELLEQGDFDVVLTDIVMPAMSGVELLEAIRSRFPDLKVIMTTGEPTAETAASAVRAGAYDYLAKPVKRDRILTVVRRAAEARALEVENRLYQENLENLVQERTRQLLETEHGFRALTEETPVGICLTIGESLQYANPALADLLGYEPGEMQDQDTMDFISEQHRERARNRSRALLHGGEEFPSDYDMVRKDGSIVPVQIITRVIQRDGKKALLSVIQDLSERLRMEAKEVELHIATSRLLVQEVLAGILPGLMRSFGGAVNPGQMMAQLGQKVEEVLTPRYFGDDDEVSPLVVALRTVQFFEDSGGEVQVSKRESDRHRFRISSCPWNNEEKQEPTLCQFCNLIVGGFAHHLSPRSSVQCNGTRAEGSSHCDYEQVFPHNPDSGS